MEKDFENAVKIFWDKRFLSLEQVIKCSARDIDETVERIASEYAEDRMQMRISLVRNTPVLQSFTIKAVLGTRLILFMASSINQSVINIS